MRSARRIRLLWTVGMVIAMAGAAATAGRLVYGEVTTAIHARIPAAAPHTGTTGSRPLRALTILGAGDVLLHPQLWRQAAADAAAGGRTGYDFHAAFAGVAGEIAAADLAICHLETPLGDPGGPFTGYPAFVVPPQIAKTLHDIGFDGCSTASNHTLDAGKQGVYRTLDVLDAASLRHAGSYRSAAAQASPDLLAVNGVTIAHLAYTYGFNGQSRPAGAPWIANLIEPTAILAAAHQARAAGADIVVASLHWGDEYDHRPSAVQVALARQLLVAGAVDIILGTHAHAVQPIARIGPGWVVYGMGNEIARQSDALTGWREGIMPRITLAETTPGQWRVTKMEAIATWIETSPRIRIVGLAAAIADPTTPATARQTYLAAHRRIGGYLQSAEAVLV